MGVCLAACLVDSDVANESQDKEPQEDNRDAILHGLGESLDINTFSQILEMDDDETDREFSKSIVYGFFEQAESTMEQMKSAM